MKQPSDTTHLSIDDLFYKDSSGSPNKKYIIIRPVTRDTELQNKLTRQRNVLTRAGFEFYSQLVTNIALNLYTLDEASKALGIPADQILILNHDQQKTLCELKLDDIKLYQPFRDILLHAGMSREMVDQLLNEHGNKIESLTIDPGFDLSNLPSTSNLSAIKKLKIQKKLMLEDELTLLPHLTQMTAIEELNHKQGINCSEAFRNFIESLNNLNTYGGSVIKTLKTEKLKRLYLDAHEAESETIQALMNKIKTLEELSIFNCPKHTEVSLAHLTITQSLSADCRIDLPKRSSLASLNVLELTIKDLFIFARHRYTCRFPNLQKLFIQNIPELPPLNLKINLIPKLTTLTTLNLSGDSYKDFKFLKVMLQVTPNLNQLYFNMRYQKPLLSLKLSKKIKRLIKISSNQEKPNDTDNRYTIFARTKAPEKTPQNSKKTIGHGK